MKITETELWEAVGGLNSGLTSSQVWGILKKLEKYNVGIKEGFLSNTVEGDKDEIISNIKEVVERERIEKDRERLVQEFGSIEAAHEHEQEQKEISKVLITSGFSFDGYKIKRYSGYISGDDCVTLPRDTFWGNNSVDKHLCDALVKIRQQALRELKEAAYALDCNAVIGVDFDYLVMDPQHAAALNASVTVYEPYVICVTANGNAVFIEKE